MKMLPNTLIPGPHHETRWICAVQTPQTLRQCGNLNFIEDLREACGHIFVGAERGYNLNSEDRPLRILQHPMPSGPLELPDQWIRDQFLILYADAPAPIPYVVECVRRPNGMLRSLVANSLAKEIEEIPESIGIVHLQGDSSTAIDFGGNLLCTPPLRSDHGAQQIIVSGKGSSLLSSLGIKPSQNNLLIDTSWLAVGHVDEVVSFAPSRSSDSDVLTLLASSPLARKLLEKSTETQRSTPLMRGKWICGERDYFDHYCELPANRLLSNLEKEESGQGYSDFQNAIKYLRDTLGSFRSAMLEIPVLFLTPDSDEIPKTTSPNRIGLESALPNLVNIEYVTRRNAVHALLPRVFGPRVPKAEAEEILHGILKELGYDCNVQHEDASGWQSFWGSPGESIERIPFYFCPLQEGPIREEFRALLKAGSIPKRLNLNSEDRNYFDKIVSSLATQLSDDEVMDGKLTRWKKLMIPDPAECVYVDLFESYMQSVLGAHGLIPWFLDTWEYHARGGGLHCGTNQMREIPSYAVEAKDAA